MSSNIRIQKICQYCNSEFTAKTTVTKYCGDNCAKRAYKNRKRSEKLDVAKTNTKQEIERPIVELNAKPYLSVEEVGALLGVSRRTVYRLADRGELVAGKIGRRTLFRREDLDKIFKV